MTSLTVLRLHGKRFLPTSEEVSRPLHFRGIQDGSVTIGASRSGTCKALPLLFEDGRRDLGDLESVAPHNLLLLGVLLFAIEKTLLDQGVHTSWASVRDALATHAIVTIVLPTDSGATMRTRKASTPETEHREWYRMLGVDAKIMSPKTIWSETGDRG